MEFRPSIVLEAKSQSHWLERPAMIDNHLGTAHFMVVMFHFHA